MSRQKKEVTSVEEKPSITFSDVSEVDKGEVKIQKSRKEQTREILKKFAEEETKLVKGKFRNYETPGGAQRVLVKKYGDVPMFDKVMEDEHIYEIPLYVARHLNGVDVTAKKVNGKINTCAYPVHGFKWENREPPQGREMGNTVVPLIVPSKWTRRYGFESLEFDVEL